MAGPHQPAGAGGQEAKPITLSLPLRFERPVAVTEHAEIGRIVELMLDHEFEIHDITPKGERITRVNAGDHIQLIELDFDEDDAAALQVRFTVGSREDRDVLVWTSSLMFQYLHYHLVRLTAINNAPHTLDWEAGQDPDFPERVREWVEVGQSRIERLKRVQRS